MAAALRNQLNEYSTSEAWEVEHEEAQVCWEVEELLQLGIYLSGRISAREQRIQEIGLGQAVEVVDAWLAEIDEWRRSWLDASERHLAKAEGFAAKCYEVEGLEEFRSAVEEVRILIGNAEFEKELLPLDEMLILLRPDNPRPDRYPD